MIVYLLLEVSSSSDSLVVTTLLAKTKFIGMVMHLPVYHMYDILQPNL